MQFATRHDPELRRRLWRDLLSAAKLGRRAVHRRLDELRRIGLRIVFTGGKRVRP